VILGFDTYKKLYDGHHLNGHWSLGNSSSERRRCNVGYF